MKGQRFGMLLVAILLLTGFSQAQEQERPRFTLPDRAPSTAELKALLGRRQSLARDEEQVRKLVQNMLKGNFDATLLKQLQQQLQDNPELKKQIEGRLLQQPELRKQVESILKESRPTPEQLRDLAGKLTPPKQPWEGREDNPGMPPIPPPPMPDPGMPPVPMPERPQTIDPEIPQPMPVPPSTPPVPEKESTPDWFRKQATEWASTWTQSIRNLDNDTLKGIVEQIQKSGLAPSKLELPEWIKNSTSDLTGDLKNWLPDMSGPQQSLRDAFSGWPAPDLGNWNVSTPDLPSPEAAGQGLGWLLATVLFGAGLWALWATRGLGFFKPDEEKTARRRLGPWPVSPDQVSTRGQIVQCFEYLARRVLGVPAETAHHHEVARQLRQQSHNPQQQQAADELAELYEQARYTPPAEKLGPNDVARARAALRVLATVTPA